MESRGRPPSAVIFDLDGTLVDSRDDIAASVNAALARVGAAPRPPAEIHARIGEPLSAIFAPLLGAGRGHLLGDAIEAYRAHYHDNCARASTVYPGVVDGLARLAPIPLAIATTKSTAQAVRVCEAHGLARWFAAIQGCDGIPCKPDPAVVRAALARVGAGPEGAWMVGDTALDVRAGRAAGCRTCAVTWGIADRDALAAERPDLLVDDFAQLSGLLLAGAAP